MKNGFFFYEALLHKVDCFIDVFVDGHLFASAVEGAVSVITVFDWQRGIWDHVIGEVPLAKMCRGVSLLLKEPWQQRSVGAKPIGHATFGVVLHVSKVAIDFIACRKVSCHHGRAARRANAAGDSETMEVSALCCKAIDIRRFHIGMAMAAKIAPAPVVGEDKNDVRRLLSRKVSVM